MEDMLEGLDLSDLESTQEKEKIEEIDGLEIPNLLEEESIPEIQEPVELQNNELVGRELADSRDENYSLLDPTLEMGIAGTVGAGLGKAAKTIIEPLTDPSALKEKAERLAYAAIGGEESGPGKNFLKSKMEQLYDPKGAINITPEKIGRYALDDELIGKYGIINSGKAFDKAEEGLKGSIEEKYKLLKGLDKADIPLESVQSDISDMMVPNLDELSEADRMALNFAEKEADVFQGYRTPLELEKTKSKMVDAKMFDPDSEGKNLYKKYKRASLNKNVQDTVEELGGDDLLKKFQGLKEDIGTKGIARDVLLKKELKAGSIPDLSMKDLLTQQSGGVEAAIARRGFKDQGASILSRGLDTVSDAAQATSEFIDKIPGGKTAKKVGGKFVKYLPLIGGLATAIESGEAQDAIPFLGDSERVGSPKGTLDYKLESGERLNDLEQKQLQDQMSNNYKQIQDTNREKYNSRVKKLDRNSYQNLYDKVEMSQDPILQKFIEPMAKGLQGDQQREQMMFSLSQHPSFRKKISELMD